MRKDFYPLSATISELKKPHFISHIPINFNQFNMIFNEILVGDSLVGSAQTYSTIALRDRIPARGPSPHPVSSLSLPLCFMSLHCPI